MGIFKGKSHKMNTFRQRNLTRLVKQKVAAIIGKAPTVILSLLVAAFVLSVDLEFVVNKIGQTNYAGSLISAAVADDNDDDKRKAEREEHERNESAAERAREEQKEARKRAEKDAKRARKEAKKARKRAEKAAKKARKDAKKRAERLAEQQRRDKKELDEAREQERKESAARSRRDSKKSAQRASKKRTSPKTKTSSRATSRKSSERSDDSDRDEAKREDEKVYKSASRKTEEDDKRDEDQRSAQNNSDDDNDNNDGDDDSSDNDKSRSSKKYKVENEDKTPDTLLKLFQQVFTPSTSSKSKTTTKSKSKSKNSIDKKPSNKKPSEQKKKQLASSKKAAAKAKTAARKRPRRRVFAPVTPRARFMPSEVLAINMNRRSLRRARQMGFRVGRTSQFSGLNLRVHSLRPPRGMSAGRARRFLRRNIPGSELALNSVYRVYHAARGRQQGVVQHIAPVEKLRRFRRCGQGKCYATKAIRWRRNLTSCARTVKIGVIDTAYDKKHPAFYGQRIYSGQRSNAERWRAAPNKHGTGVLALLTGNPKTTTAGLIPGATFIAHNVFFADKAGNPVSDTTSMLDALNLMNGFGVDIINLSLTGPKDPVIAKVIAEMSKNGIIFVAAAGNGGPAAKPSYPAAYPQVIAVTAVNRKSRGYRYANRGSYIDIAAPGVDIWTALPGSKAGYQSGTSFAVPYVTAVIASIYKQYGPMSKEQILRHITTRDLGAPGRDRVYGRGLVLAPRRCKKAPALAKASLLR